MSHISSFSDWSGTKWEIISWAACLRRRADLRRRCYSTCMCAHNAYTHVRSCVRSHARGNSQNTQNISNPRPHLGPNPNGNNTGIDFLIGAPNPTPKEKFSCGHTCFVIQARNPSFKRIFLVENPIVFPLALVQPLATRIGGSGHSSCAKEQLKYLCSHEAPK